MSILRTHNLQNPDSSSINIVMDQGGNTNITGVTTVGSNFHVTSGKIGIGTNVPARLLHLHESNSNEALITFTTPTTGSTSGDGFRVGMNGSEEAIVWNSENGVIKFGTNNTERLRITSAGQMGLGTNDPNSYGGSVKLAVANTSGTCGLSIVSATNGDGNLYYADGTSGDATYRGYIRYNHTLDQFRIGAAGAERLRIDANGRILVGPGAIATPKCGYAGIDVPNNDWAIIMGGSDGNGNRANNANKDGRFAGAHYVNAEEPIGIIRCTSGATANELHMGGGTSLVNAATQLSFYTAANTTTTGGTERLRITSGGQVQIPVNASGATSGRLQLGASQQLTIFQDSANAYLANDDFIISNGAVNEILARFKNGNAVELYYDNTKRFETTSAGVKITSNLYLGGSTNGGFSYNAIADTLEFLTTNGGTHSELNSGAYVPGTNGGKHLGNHNKRWDNVFCNGVRFGGNNAEETTLDDYEEGTWTPAYTPASGSFTPFYNNGTYTRIGRKVTVTGVLSNNGSSSPSGTVKITGLPFTVSGHGMSWTEGGGTGTLFGGYGFPKDQTNLVCRKNSTQMNVYDDQGNYLQASEINTSYNGGQSSFMVTYFTTD